MNEQNDYLKFACKLSIESNDVLFVSDGHTVLFEIRNGENAMGVGLNTQDVEQLIAYLNNFL